MYDDGYYHVTENRNDILDGYNEEINKLKNHVSNYGLNYEVSENEYPLLFNFLKGRSNGAEYPSGYSVFRARIIRQEDVEEGYIGKSEHFKGFCKEKCGAPPASICRGQRVNSEYQRYLYCALDDYTALAETRPHLSQQISIAKLRLVKKVKLFSLIETNHFTTNARDSYSYILSNDLSKPVADCDKFEDYRFTQYISNLIRLNQFDGIEYLSSLNYEAKNVVFFNPDIAEAISSNIYTLKRLCYGAYNLDEGASIQHTLLEKADAHGQTEII